MCVYTYIIFVHVCVCHTSIYIYDGRHLLLPHSTHSLCRSLSLVPSLSRTRAFSLIAFFFLSLSLSRTHVNTISRSRRLAASAVYIYHTHTFSHSVSPLSLSLTRTQTHTNSVKTATSAGIGFFLAHLGLQTAQGIGLVVTDIATG